MTELAFIAPFDMLNQSSFGKYHLMLPHLTHFPVYAEHFLKLCKDEDKYVVLDNGAAEDEQITFENLIATAMQFNVNELVVPDKLGDAVGTYQLLEPFLNRAMGALDTVPFTLGYVLQGQGMRSVMWHIDRILGSSLEKYIGVWYLPRLLLEEGDIRIRLNLARIIQQADDRHRPVHFLGMYPSLPEELHLQAYYGPEIRSWDTSLPYVYALEGRYVETEDNPHITRQEDYFEAPIPAATRMIGLANCETLERWASKK